MCSLFVFFYKELFGFGYKEVFVLYAAKKTPQKMGQV